MPLYESVFIARQDIAPTQVETITTQMVELIKQGGGNVTKIEPWGLRTLAYKINKNKKGHYVLLNIDAPAAAITEMERNLRLNEDVLRYLSVRVEALDAAPSAILSRERDDRFEDDDRGGMEGRGAPRGGFENRGPRRSPSGRAPRSAANADDAGE